MLALGIDIRHEMARKAFDQAAGIKIIEAFLIERGSKRPQPRLAFIHRHQADHGAEDEPFRRLILIRRSRPGEANAADEPAVDQDRIGPIEADRLLGRGMRRERIAERAKPDIEGAPRQSQRFLGLEHDCKLGEIEAADMNQRAGALLRRDRARMREGIARLAQGHQAERRRQIEAAPKWRADAASGPDRHQISRAGGICLLQV